MQKIKFLILLIVMAIFSSCQFNQSVHKDLKTGAYSRGDGIGSDGVVIEINGKKENRNEFISGEKVRLIFNDITGLTYSNGKAFPGISMYIVKNEKDTVFSNPNFLKKLTKGTDLSPLQLQASFTAILPNKNNEKYKALVEIWDTKGNGKFNYELPFTVKESDLLNTKSDGIEYSNIYLWNKTLEQIVLDKNINAKHELHLKLTGVEGLEIINGKNYPLFSLEITENDGSKLLSEPNLLSDYEEEGVDPKVLKNQLYAKITFTKGNIKNPCKLSAKLKDKNSSKELNITAELNIN